MKNLSEKILVNRLRMGIVILLCALFVACGEENSTNPANLSYYSQAEESSSSSVILNIGGSVDSRDGLSYSSSNALNSSESGYMPFSSSEINEVSEEISSSESAQFSSSAELSSSAESSSSVGSEYDASTNTLKDLRDGQTYKTVTIGSQIWMAENLNIETADSYCYDDIESNCTKYGRLYTWAAAMDSAGTWDTGGEGCGFDTICQPTIPVRGVCPDGWHLPSTGDWDQLKGFDIVALRSASGWRSNCDDKHGEKDSLGFSVLPAGYMRPWSGDCYGYIECGWASEMTDLSRYVYDGEGSIAYFWTSAQVNNNVRRAFYMDFSCDVNHPYRGDDTYKSSRLSVRCVKDKY